MEETLIAGVFAMIGAAVGATATLRNRRLDAEARARAELEAAVVEYVTSLEELLVSLDLLGLREMPGERYVTRFLETSIGLLLTAPLRLLTYLALPVLSSQRQANRLRRASRRLALTADADLLRVVANVERLLETERKDATWAEDVRVAAAEVTLAGRRAITPRPSRMPWRPRDTTDIAGSCGHTQS